MLYYIVETILHGHNVITGRVHHRCMTVNDDN